MLKSVIALAFVAGLMFQASVADSEAEASAQASVESSGDDVAEASAVASAESYSNEDDYYDCEPEPPKPKCQKKNEVFEICPARCPFRTCGIDDRLVRCAAPPQPGDPNCPKDRCRCKSGFFRDSRGECVRWEQCNTNCTGVNEVYDACDSPCPARECGVDPALILCKPAPQVGDEECLVGCRCKDGFVRNDKGVCVAKNQCPQKCNRPNEVFVQCPDCSPQTCETKDRIYHCPLIPSDPYDKRCKPSCRCKPGFFRNKIGDCISAENCDKCKGDHEYWSCGSACDNVCGSKYGQDNCNIQNIVCNKKCYCEKGYARATNGTCIPKADCQYECPKNERYEQCPANICGPKKCSDAGFPSAPCEIPGENSTCPVKPGCVCNDGFLRNSKGVCIPTKDCPSCGGDKNATVGCGVNCGRLCSNYMKKDIACILICYADACDCRKGYVYDSNTKRCVLPKDCTPVCKKNEVYSMCTNGGCDKKKCTDLNKPRICIDPVKCNEGCICAPGFLRAKNGTCVDIDKCDVPLPVCKPNEEFSKCGLDGCKKRYCSDLDLPPLCRDTFSCDPSCECKEGFLRASYSNDTCVPVDQCPPVSCNGDINARPGCGVHCGNRCSNYKNAGQIACPAICYVNGCDCKDGFVFDDNSQLCVKPEDCPPICKPDEVLSNCANNLCRIQDCSQKGQTILCKPVAPGSCKPGCVCPDKYLRAQNGTCVPEDQCDEPPKDTCKENEILVDCPEAQCGPKTCDQAGFPVACPRFSRCPGKPGCVCADGYLRNSDGVCIAKEKCPSCGGDVNAQPGCGGHCGNRCSTYNLTDPVLCQTLCEFNGCDCRSGYVFDDNTQQCVKPDKCTKQCGVNEEFSNCSNGLCRVQDCADRGKKRPCPPMVPGSCIPGCVCPDKFLRSKNGTCVPEDQCDVPPDPTCPNNEILVKCGESMCQPETCKEAGFPVPCPIVGPNGQCPGKPRCICISGYLRNSKGVCIPKNNCPSCGGDKNAIPGCGVNCGRLCSNYNSPNKPFCPLFCNLNGCDCKKNYVYDGNRRKCVLPEKCSPICKPGEELSECSNALCRHQKCEDKGKPVACPGVTKCIPGCVCPEKYLRAANNTCIPEDQCSNESCPEGEIFNTCPPPKCDGEYCPRTRNDPQTCSYPDNNSSNCGKPRCVCGFNRHRDRKTGKCIATSQCPKFKCDGPNESFNNCVPVCPGEKCEDYIKNSTCPRFRIGIVVPCKLGCRCDKGYYRNSRNICIPGHKCKKSDCSSTSSTNEPTTVGTTNNCDADAQKKALEKGNTAVTVKMLYQVSKLNPGVSVFMSAFSLLTPLAELALYSKGPTYTQIASILNVQNKSDIRCGFPALLDSVKAPENGTILDLAAKIYVYDKGTLSKSFADDSKNIFNAEAESINFSNGAAASKTINQWVSDATRGKITELVSPDMFDDSTRLALLNAIYFKGLWKNQFNKNNTKPRDFYANGETIQVPTMTQKGKFNYGELSDPDVQILELPCKDENISVMFILPKQKDGLATVIEKMQEPSVFDNMVNSLSKQTVTMYIPKVEGIESTIDLKQVLELLGVHDIFDPSKAQLSGLTKPDEDLVVSKGSQKAFVSMDEDGAVAAAANAITVVALAAVVEVQQFYFEADHPYAFCVNIRGMPLFCGTFYG